MPFATINDVSLKYETLGEAGPWVALSPGARRSMAEMQGLASHLAAEGYRILLHDRRNTGESGLSIDGEGSEFEIWADDLYALMRHLGIASMSVGGSSSGCRLSTLFALRYPQAVESLLMMRATGGAFAVKRLAFGYYTKFIEAAQRGGMAEVCATDHFKDMAERNEESRATIMAWPVDRFIDVMTRWRTNLERGIETPILGATAQDLASIKAPVCVIPGNDNTHSMASGRLAHSLIPGAELHELRTDQLDVDLISFSEWASDDKIAAVLADFLRRKVAGSA